MRVFLALSAVLMVAACAPKPASAPSASGATPAPATPAPGANAAPVSNGGDVVIGVGPDGTYTINGQPTHAKTLQEALEEVSRRNAEGGKAGGAK